jgi:hypothetical protein
VLPDAEVVLLHFTIKQRRKSSVPGLEFTHFLTSAYSLPKNDKKSAASF